jgi:hypothetical protein
MLARPEHLAFIAIFAPLSMEQTVLQILNADLPHSDPGNGLFTRIPRQYGILSIICVSPPISVELVKLLK